MNSNQKEIHIIDDYAYYNNPNVPYLYVLKFQHNGTIEYRLRHEKDIISLQRLSWKLIFYFPIILIDLVRQRIISWMEGS